MQRFFVESIDSTLDKELCHQILHVMRMKTGGRVILLDNTGNEYICAITINGKNIDYKVVEKRINQTEPSINVTLYQSLLKSPERFEFSLQKATELGVSEITPLITERCQTTMLRKKDRCEKIIREASEQSERGKMPLLNDPMKFKDLLANLQNNETDTNLFFYEGLRDSHFKLPKLTKNVNVIIGPEGGFSELEAEQIEEFCKQNKNSHILSLGKRILRSETASIVALAQILINY